MTATLEQLAQIRVLSALSPEDLAQLQASSHIQNYSAGEIVMVENDRLPTRLFAVVSGTIQVSKTAATGKETILRLLSAGEIFAAPALLGNGIAPATVTAETDCTVLTVERDALLRAIQHTPEIALQMMMVLNQRIQRLHEMVHGLASERAIVRLARLIQYTATEQGTRSQPDGQLLKTKMSHYQISRSIGITYEECVRLFKQLQPIVKYARGGKITIQNWQELEAIATGDSDVTA